jgi:RNA polymerase sigma factor (sigma-70 family)
MGGALPPELSRLLHAVDRASREEAWTRFVRTHTRLLLHVARSLNHDYDTAMDAYAFILEQLRRDDFTRLSAYVANSRCKFSTWLVVVSRRLCLDHLRQRYGRARDPAESAYHGEPRAARRRLMDLLGESIDPDRIAQPSSADPESELEARDLNEALASALSALHARDRLLLKLRFEDGLSAREIAEVMDLATPFHVYRRLNALLASLRRWLLRRGVKGSAQ